LSRYEIERDIDGFIERWLERTADFEDFVPASIVWSAMLHSAGLPPNTRTVWGIGRRTALWYMRDKLSLMPQRVRYYRYPQPVTGMAPGGTFGCFEQLKLSEYALRALDAPMQVRPRVPRRALARL